MWAISGHLLVSIPIGFSSSLQRKSEFSQLVIYRPVSIPIGFSSSLQLIREFVSRSRLSRFQSLSGFQVRCNFMDLVADRPKSVLVSIPIGFSSSLQRIQNGYQITELDSFNPYRVFKFVATPPFPPGSTDGRRRFQSISGVQVGCNT